MCLCNENNRATSTYGVRRCSTGLILIRTGVTLLGRWNGKVYCMMFLQPSPGTATFSHFHHSHQLQTAHNDDNIINWTSSRNKMFLTGFWQPTPRKHKFQAVKTENDDDEIDSEGLISARKKTGKSAVSIPWICFTTANLVILSITVSLILSVQSTQAHEKNTILRPV